MHCPNCNNVIHDTSVTSVVLKHFIQVFFICPNCFFKYDYKLTVDQFKLLDEQTSRLPCIKYYQIPKS
jgi:hypothetical protein